MGRTNKPVATRAPRRIGAKAKSGVAGPRAPSERLVDTGIRPNELRSAEDLTAELKESLDCQTAVSEVLRVMSQSPADVQPVLDAIVENAKQLVCGFSATVLRVVGDALHLAAFTKTDDKGARALHEYFPLPITDSFILQPLRTGLPIQVEDAQSNPDVTAEGRAMARARGFRANLLVPLVREGQAIGLISVTRSEAGTFPARQVDLLKTFADQAVIAIENARLFNETQDALDRQTATAGVLKVISESPTDVQPVFDIIAEHATRLTSAEHALVARYDGEWIKIVSAYGTNPKGWETLRQMFPMRLDGLSITARAIRTGTVVNVANLLAESEAEFDTRIKATIRLIGWRSALSVPMLRDGQIVGAVTVNRSVPGQFAEKEVELLQTFASQAVIAIQNTRLFNETKEALGRQTATADILHVISSSPTNVQPVFDAIVRTALRLLSCDSVVVMRCDGNTFSPVAGVRQDGAPIAMTESLVKVDPDDNFPSRVILSKSILHLPDWQGIDLPEHERRIQESHGVRSSLLLPLLREGECIGVLALVRKTPGAFSEAEITLARSFVDQALIAIENTRLFNETKEALEQQTAISEILRVISASPGDVRPMLNAVAERALILCDAAESGIFLVEGDALRFAAGYGSMSNFVPGDRQPLTRGLVIGRATLDRQTYHYGDIVPLLDTEYPDARPNQAKFGFRAILCVPLMREDRAIGVVALWRTEARQFTDNQIALVKTFADQAAIAIENVRLFNETKEALNQQRAASDVLAAISGSIADTAPVFATILDSCERLFSGNVAGVNLVGDDGLIHLRAYHGPNRAELERVFPLPLDEKSGSGACIVSRSVVHYPDTEDESVPEATRRACRAAGYRSVIFAPMVWEARGIGVIFVGRAYASPFSEKDMALLRTFADQAVIAIQNARLFNETKEALEQQKASAEVLEVISGSVENVTPVFEKILDSCERLFGTEHLGIVVIRDDGLVYPAAIRGSIVKMMTRTLPMPADKSTTGRAIRDRRIVQIHDMEEFAASNAWARETVDQVGAFSAAWVPMMWEDRGVGSIMVVRQPAAPFSEKDEALLRTFADQAVIAIQNARLFNETKEALEQQTATAEVLQVISSSVADTAPVFDKILDSCQHLFATEQLGIFLAGDDGMVHVGAWRGSALETIAATFPKPLDETMTAIVIRDRRTMHIPDVLGMSPPVPIVRGVAERIGNCSIAWAPMLWEERGIGSIAVLRQPPKPFSEKELVLLRTFADQSVIAIQNARMFNETKEALEQQTATAEVLQVISSSVADTAPVFDKILDSCQRLFASEQLGIFLLGDDGRVRVGVARLGIRAVSTGSTRIGARDFTGQAIRERRTSRWPSAAIAGSHKIARIATELLGNYSAIYSPMLWEGRGIGSMCVFRQPPRPFTDKEIGAARHLRRPGGDRDPECAAVQAGAGSSRRGRNGERGEELVPRHDEPRDPYADERRDRDERAPPRHPARRRAARLRGHDPRFR